VDPWKGRRDLWIDRYLARRTARIVANSPGVKDFYVDHGLPEEKFTIIPNGIPPAKPCPTTREGLLEELGLPEESRLIGIVGRLWPQKRVKDAIWATDLLKVVRDDVHLLIIGDGPQRNRLRRYRDQVEIRDKVHFLGHRQDAAGIIPHLEMLWSTSAYEGQSNSIMEAMSAGVPVVATDIPGTRDLVVHERTGYLVPFDGLDTRRRRAAFARHANTLLEDRELARRMGNSGRERMLNEFSVEKMVGRHVDLYRELLG
jgi:glycosyltransferase involved in cell wall biosynthesis